jgi:hypothetical protein
MTIKNIYILAFIILVICFVLYSLKSNHDTELVKNNIDNTNIVGFSWRFENANSLNGDGNPNTDIFIDILYENREVVSKLVQVSHGSCNELEEVERDSLAGTKNVLCYGAGLGYRLKIVKVDNLYRIMRQTFEEGSPDYTPTILPYETIAEF